VDWLEIADYSDFYDVPHCIVVDRPSAMHLR
jgi:hypothetical protein